MLTQIGAKSSEKLGLSLLKITKLSAPSNGQKIYWDHKVSNLGVRVTKNGVKAFVIQSRLFGKTLRLTIGSANRWTLQEARKEARRMLVLIDRGIDPRNNEQLPREPRPENSNANIRLLDIWTDYIDIKKSDWSPRYYQEHLDLSRNGGEIISKGRKPNMPAFKEVGFLRPLLNLKLDQLNPEVIHDWAREHATKRPTKTRLALSMFKAFINWMNTNSKYEVDITEKINFKSIFGKQPQKIKIDCLQVEQLESWFIAVMGISNKIISAYLQALLITGARRGELAGLKWDEIDTRWKTIFIKDKIKGSRVIPLTPYVESLILDLPKFNKFVFSSQQSSSGFIKEPRIAHNLAIQKANLPHLTIHGLRRSFGTLAEWTQCPVGISAQIMGHAPSALAEKHYRQRSIDLLRKWHVEIESFILRKANLVHLIQ